MSNATTIKVNGVREFIPKGAAVAIDKDGYLYRIKRPVFPPPVIRKCIKQT